MSFSLATIIIGNGDRLISMVERNALNGGPAALAALETRNAAERQAQLCHAPLEAAAERSARAWDNSEIVLDLNLAGQ